jgi:trypsin
MSSSLILLLVLGGTAICNAFDDTANAMLPSQRNSTHNDIVNPAILGGEVAGVDEFPWFGRLNITLTNRNGKSSTSCGASLIHSDIVVSSAQCLVDDIRDTGATYAIKFYLGANKYDGSDGIALDVVNITWPGTYSFPTDDIVLMKLRNSTIVAPVSWNKDPSIPKLGDLGRTIGFGLTSDSGSISPVLRKVDLPTISSAECKRIYRLLPASITCSYAPNSGKDVCEGGQS